MFMTIIDRWTSWPEAYPLSATGDAASARVCARIITREWIPRFGVPDIITTDRGSQFTSDLWASMCKLMGITRVMTTAYHPQHYGKIERWHRSLKAALRSWLFGSHNWMAELPWVLLGQRTSPNLDTGVSPSVLVTGQHPALPGHLVVPKDDILDYTAFSEQLARALRTQVLHNNPWHDGDKSRRPVPQVLRNTSSVLVRCERLQSFLNLKYDGPYTVIGKHPKYFTILRNGRQDAVSIDRLKPFHQSKQCPQTGEFPMVPVIPCSITNNEAPGRPRRVRTNPVRYGMNSH